MSEFSAWMLRIALRGAWGDVMGRRAASLARELVSLGNEIIAPSQDESAGGSKTPFDLRRAMLGAACERRHRASAEFRAVARQLARLVDRAIRMKRELVEIN